MYLIESLSEYAYLCNSTNHCNNCIGNISESIRDTLVSLLLYPNTNSLGNCYFNATKL